MCAVDDADHAAYVVVVGDACAEALPDMQVSCGLSQLRQVCMHHDRWGMGFRRQEMRTALMTSADTAVTAVPTCGRGGVEGAVRPGLVVPVPMPVPVPEPEPFGCGGGRGSLTSTDPDTYSRRLGKQNEPSPGGRDDGTVAGTDRAHYDGPAP